MTLRKLTAGEIVAGLAGALLIADLFAPWFGGESGWGSFTVVLAPLLISAVLGIALLVTTALQRSQAYPVAAEVFAFAFAGLTTLILVVELIVRSEPDWGAWLGLLAVLGVGAGSWVALRAAVRP